jgi:acyl-CoA thioesterase
MVESGCVRRRWPGSVTVVGNPFLDGSVVQHVGEGRYAGEIDPVWNLRPLPQGGFVTALAARAMAAELDNPDERLRVLHTTFAGQVAEGPVDIDVEVLRRGRSMSHLRAEVRNEGAVRGHLTIGAFGTRRQGFDFTDAVAPAVPPPEQCPSFRDPPPPEAADFPFTPMRFWEEVLEGRNALGHPPWESYVPDRAERAQWFTFDQPPFLDDGTIDPLALVVLCDVMPGAVGEKVGPTERQWFAPSVDLTVHLLGECRTPVLLGHSHARFAGDGYASAEMHLWDCGPEGRDAPRLVAYATQLFLFSFVD